MGARISMFIIIVTANLRAVACGRAVGNFGVEGIGVAECSLNVP
jgi:hypothetical protein